MAALMACVCALIFSTGTVSNVSGTPMYVSVARFGTANNVSVRQVKSGMANNV
jgi:hypothetical protein